MRARATRIRRSVAALTAALLCSVFLFLYVQLASGHDPALAAKAQRSAASSTLKAARRAGEQRETAPSAATREPSSGESSSGESSSGEASGAATGEGSSSQGSSSGESGASSEGSSSGTGEGSSSGESGSSSGTGEGSSSGESSSGTSSVTTSQS